MNTVSTVEELIGLRALQEMQSRLQERLDPRTWTIQNRDQELSEIWQTANEIVEESAPVTLQVMQTEIQGKSFLFWNLRVQVMGSLIEFLENARRDLDYLSEEEREAIPVTSEWLTEKIREYIPQYQEAYAQVEQVLNALRDDPLIESEVL